MDKQLYKIIIAGEGGQGVQALAHVFASAAFGADLHVAYMPNYGVEQRGGVSLGYLQVGKGVIGFPKFKTADIIVLLCARAIERVGEYVGEKTLCIYDSSQINGADLKDIIAEKLPIPATKVATEKLSSKVFNMILAGALVSELKFVGRADLEKSLDKIFADKYKSKPELRHLNQKALVLGETLSKNAYKV